MSANDGQPNGAKPNEDGSHDPLRDTMPILLGDWDARLNCRYVNDACLQWFGLPAERIIGRSAKEVMDERAFFKLSPVVERALAGEQVQFRDRLPWRGGVERDVQIDCFPRQHRSEADTACCTVFQDVTQRVHEESRLKATTKTLEDLVEERAGAIKLMHDVTVACHKATTVGEALDRVLRLFSQFNGWCFGHAYLPSADNTDLLAPVREFYEELPGRFHAFRSAMRNLRLECSQGLPGRAYQSGEVQWTEAVAEDLAQRSEELDEIGIVAAIAIPITLAGETAGVLEFFSDKAVEWDDRMVDAAQSVGAQLGRVIERKRLERLLANKTARQQREIAQQIHDTVLQQISGVAIISETLRQDLLDVGSPLADQANRLVDYLKASQDQLRKITRGLLPVEVDSKGLMKALEDLAEATTDMHGVDCRFECERPVAVHDNATATNLFYIVQEAVHNAVKHAGANRILIQMKLERDLLRLLVRDDGKGIETSSARRGGMGMRIMRHRSGVIGADLDVVSQPGGGTSVFCYLTLEDGQRDE